MKGEKQNTVRRTKECMKTTRSMRSLSARSRSAAASPRQTFYRNFLDKYDLINWYFDKPSPALNIWDAGPRSLTVWRKNFIYIQEKKTFFAAAFRYDR